MNDAYAAGLIDGEGSVTLPKYNRSVFRYPSVTVSSTTPALVEFLRSNYGGCISVKTESRQPHHKVAYHWCLQRNDAIEFLEKVLPFMREPEKVRRAQMIVDEYRSVTPRNGRYTEAMKSAKLSFQERFFSTSTHVNTM